MKNNWQFKKLGDVCKTSAGGTPLKSCKAYYENGEIPWLVSGEISQGEIYQSKYFITDSGLKNSSAKLFPADTVLVAMYGATAGQVGILKFPATTNQAICGILPDRNFLPQFIYYFFLFIKNDLIKLAVGGAQPNISQIKIKDQMIPILTIPEQKRIVAILDKAFFLIAKAKKNAEKNLQNVSDVFESYLKSVFTNPKKNWRVKKLGDVCTIIGGGTPSKSNAAFYNGNILWATVCDMKNEVIFDTKYKITLEAVKKSATNIIPKNNIVIATRVGLGKVCLLKNDTAINQDLRGIIPKNTMNFSIKYLYWWLKSISKIIVESGTGATVQGVKLSFIKNLEIFTFPLCEQQQIATKLDALSTQTKKLIDIYQKKIANLEELKKSLLQKAFNGELTDNVVNKNMELLL